jgi:predicted RND superfamily exporter protein
VNRWFKCVINNPVLIVSLSMISIVGFATLLPALHKDTSPDAYIEPDNPALLYRDKVKETFGLDDTFVIAVQAPAGQTIYTIEALGLIAKLTELAITTPNIDADRVSSITTEKIIAGTADAITISSAYDEPPSSQSQVDDIRRRIDGFPIFHGSLVARDGSVTMIVAEMLDQTASHQTFLDLSEGIKKASANYPGIVHLAGEAATAGYLDSYITQDARRSYPLVALFIILVLTVAFRSLSGVLLPFSIAIATAIATIGIRAYFGVPFYAISNGLVIVLISISVADAIHIISEYRDELSSGKHTHPSEALAAALSTISRPVLLTTVTTIAGFIGIYFGSEMPPMQAFGLYAAIGVLAAWVYSVSFLPAVLTLLHRNKPISVVYGRGRTAKHNVLSDILAGMANFVVRYPKKIVIFSSAFLVVCIYGTTLVVVDYSRIRNFAENEEVRIADTLINASMDGSYRLLVVVDAKRPQGIFDPDVARRIEALQNFALTLPHVNGASSIIDTLKEVNQGLHGGDPHAKRLPDDEQSIAQLFLAYESIGDPADLEDDIDFDQQVALVKLRTNAGSFVSSRPIIEGLEAYLESTFNGPQVSGSLSGRVYLNYHWLKNIDANHLLSVLIAVLLALAIATVAFRSFLAGFFCLFHVVLAVFMVYAVMALFNIGLGVTTSMFAAITIGLGVDFSVHSIERVRMIATERRAITAEIIRDAFQSTGRALWFNLWALCLGFSAVLSSNNPTVAEFGGLLIVAIAANFIASMTALPAVLLVLKPKFLIQDGDRPSAELDRANIVSRTLAVLCVLAPASLMICSEEARADGVLEEQDRSGYALDIVRNVNKRNQGEHVLRDLKMVLMDKRGRERVRDAKGLRLDTPEERRAMIVYTGPANIKDTAFLTYDYHAAEREDQQWLYLPSLRRSRQVSGAERGEYFLGTDLTFEDLKQEGRLSEADYDFELIGDADADTEVVSLNGTPKTPEIAKELGYGRYESDVNTSTWMILRHRIFDHSGQLLKVLIYDGHRQVDGIWVADVIAVDNHKTGHKTRFEFSNVDFKTSIAESQLDQRNLKRAGK